MCFSASASFSAAAVLATLGTTSLIRCRTKRARMIAAIPFLFGIQQFAEGIVWLGLNTTQPYFLVLTRFAAWIFLLFAFVIWPAWVPLASMRYEGIKRPGGIAVALMAVMGCLMALKELYNLFTYPIIIEADCSHIAYLNFSSLTAFKFAAWIYLLLTTGPFFYSRQRTLHVLGMAIILSYGITAYAYTSVFTSVWCFFAAIISGYVAFIIDRL